MAKRVSSSRLVGRTEELARLEAALDGARGGIPSAMLVAGEAGIGKSRLISEFGSRATGLGASVLAGGCVALVEGELAYAPLVEALRGFLAALEPAALTRLLAADRSELAHLLPELAMADAPSRDRADATASGQARLFDLLRRLLEHLGGQAPVVLVVEDLHWADRSTLGFLSYLLRGLRRERLLLVISYRSDELPPGHRVRRWLAEQRRDARVDELELRRLSREEVADQLAGIVGSPTAELVSEVFARSEGNPFFAEELVASSDQGRRTVLPSRLREVLLVRVGECSAAAQAALRVCAAVGRRVDQRLLAAAAPLSEAELTAGLRDAVDHQLLVVQPDDDVYSFRHALLQEMIYAELLPGERAQLHAILAARLADRIQGGQRDWPASAAEVAVHWYRAHDAVNALEWSARAAIEADGVHAYAEALGHYQRTLELWPRVVNAQARAGMDHAEVLQRAAQDARMDGDSAQALALIKLALDDVDPTVQPIRAGMLYERRGEYSMFARNLNDRFDALQEAVRLIPPDPPSKERAGVLASLAEAFLSAGREEEGAAASEAAIQVARQAGADRELGRALWVLGWTQTTAGALDAGVVSLRQACRLAKTHEDPDVLARAYGALAEVLMQAGRLSEAVEVSLSGRQVALDLGLAGSWHDTYLLVSASEALFKLGRWPAADRLAQEAVAQARPDERLAFLMVAMLEVGRGDFDAAHAHLAAIEDRALDGVREIARMYLALVAELHLWQGRPDQAWAAVKTGLDLVEGTAEARSGRLFCLGMRAQADLAERGRARRDPAQLDLARRTADALVSQTEALVPNPLKPNVPIPATPAVVSLWEAERSRVHGRSDPARWQAALEAWLDLGRPYPAAYAQWRQAEALLHQRASARKAEPPLQAAHATAIGLGARPLLAVIQALARRARISLEAPHAAERELVSSAVARVGLTAREVEVLRQLAAGRSNREIGEALFISAKTASVHLSNIFRKLEVTSRVQAAAAAQQLGLVDPGSLDG